MEIFNEKLSETWPKRYGTKAPDSSHSLDKFLTHRSVRKYSGKPIEPELRELLFAAAQSAATSSNLSAWSAVVVDDPDQREKLAKLVGNQSQVREAALFLAFLADHAKLSASAKSQGESPAGLEAVEMLLVSAIDAALAAERLVCAAESIGIGSCYIGSLRNDPAGVAEVLQLPHGTFGLFGLCLGYPDPSAPPSVKPRMQQAEVFHQDVYPEGWDPSDYNRRMSEFYLEEGMKGDVTWTMRSGKRVTLPGLNGRDTLLAALQKQGFALL
jgi:nitroreductase